MHWYHYISLACLLPAIAMLLAFAWSMRKLWWRKYRCWRLTRQIARMDRERQRRMTDFTN